MGAGPRRGPRARRLSRRHHPARAQPLSAAAAILSRRLRGNGGTAAPDRCCCRCRCRCRCRRGVLLCSCSSTERGRDTPELGKWEEGSEGGQRRRRRGDRRPRRLSLLAALARRRLTPPPAAGWADSEGERDARGQAWAPRGPAGGALRRLGYGRGSCVAPGSGRASSPGAPGSRAPAD